MIFLEPLIASPLDSAVMLASLACFLLGGTWVFMRQAENAYYKQVKTNLVASGGRLFVVNAAKVQTYALLGFLHGEVLLTALAFIAGHKNVTTTAKYVRGREEGARRALEARDGFLDTEPLLAWVPETAEELAALAWLAGRMEFL